VKSPVALSSSCLSAGRSLTLGLVLAFLPALGACQGNLDNGIKQISEGSGGDSGSSSGGSTGSGGTTSTGGITGSGGFASSSGGSVGSGGVTGSGGAPASGSGGMTSGSGGKAGGPGTAGGGKSGSGGMMAAGGSKGSGGMMGTGSGGAGTVACDAPTKVFRDSMVGCIDSGCHAKGAGNQAPDLQTADPTTLKAYKTKTLCAQSSLVVPSDPTSSVLWKVVDGRTCGDLMPLGKQPLSQDQEDCLAAWIGSL